MLAVSKGVKEQCLLCGMTRAIAKMRRSLFIARHSKRVSVKIRSDTQKQFKVENAVMA
jgi:hypothetical protein